MKEKREAYQVPKCECGEPLDYWEEKVYWVTTRITKRGKKSKRDIWPDESGHGADDRLVCSKCGKEYNFTLDQKNRLVRTNEFKW